MTEYFQSLAAYNRWMNQRLYAVCADIPDVERRRDRGAFFKSLHGTLNHLLYGDRAWFGRFIQRPFGPGVGEELYMDFEVLRTERELTDDEICTWSVTLDPAWLARPFTYTSKVDGKTLTRPTWLLVGHMFNHQTHHRGQLTTLLSQMGIDYGETDWPRMPHPAPG